jgi:hypothetical protein
MKRPLFAALWLVPLFVGAAYVVSQEQPASDPAQPADQSPPAAFKATLCFIKVDWSAVPAAKEIEADLRKALSGETVPPELLMDLPASGAAVLFPMESASIYTAEHYAELMIWLTTKGLTISAEGFEHANVQRQTRVSFGKGEAYMAATATLTKDVSFLGMGPRAPSVNQPFITRKLEVSWNVESARGEMAFVRQLVLSEMARGDEQPKTHTVETSSFKLPALPAGHYLIVPAFPSQQDGTFRHAARQKGFEALLIIEQMPSSVVGSAAPRVVLPDRVARLAVNRTGQAAMSMVGMGEAMNVNMPASGSSNRYVIASNIMITWSEARDTAWGFSKSLGKWAQQELKPVPQDAKGLLAHDNLAVWQVGSTYYGFSGETGRWDVLKLPEGHAPRVVLDSGFARVHDVDDVYTFANSTGQWSSPKSGSPKSAAVADPATTGVPQFRIFTLRHIRAQDAERIVGQILADRLHSIAADERTNSLVVRAEPEAQDVIQALLVRLDEPSADPQQGANRESDLRQWPAGNPSLPALSKEYEAKEVRAAELAKQLREQQSRQPADKAQLDWLKTDLRRAVAESFAARQQLHQAELAALQQRVQQIGQTIQSRGRIQDQIIDRRVEDLLKPELQWEKAPAASPTSGAERPTPQPKVSHRTTFGEEAEKIFAELRLTVRPATEDELPGPRYRGCLKITEIPADSPAKDLRVGDIIVAVQIQGTVNRGRRVSMQILRWNETEFEHFLVPLELPAAAHTSLRGSGATGDLSSARAYRDKLRERWELIEGLHREGRFRAEDLAQAAKELGEAEIAAAATPEERQTARKDHVERLRHFHSIVKSKFEGNIATRDELLAAEAEVLKAEAELAAETAKVGTADTSPREPAPNLPTIVVPSAASGQSPILRSAEEFEQRLRDAENAVDKAKNVFPGGKPVEPKVLEGHLREPQRRLAFVREEYAAQVKLLELELQEAASAAKAAQENYQSTMTLVKKNIVPESKIIDARQGIESAQIRVERAKTLLDLYRKADPTRSADDAATREQPAEAGEKSKGRE